MSLEFRSRLALLIDLDVVEHLALSTLDPVEACVDALGYVANCLHKGQLPAIENLGGLDSSPNGSNTASNTTSLSLIRYTVPTCFQCVINDDRYLGNGKHEYVSEKVISTFLTCRNDRECAFASRQYCQVVELPDKHLSKFLRAWRMANVTIYNFSVSI